MIPRNACIVFVLAIFTLYRFARTTVLHYRFRNSFTATDRTACNGHTTDKYGFYTVIFVVIIVRMVRDEFLYRFRPYSMQKQLKYLKKLILYSTMHYVYIN